MDKQEIFELINENKLSLLEIAMREEVQELAGNIDEMMNLPIDKFDEIVNSVANDIVYDDYLWQEINDTIYEYLNKKVGEN